MNISSKYLNLHALSTLIEASNELDGVILLTPFGLVAGKLLIPVANPNISSVAEAIGTIKDNLISNYEDNGESVSLVGDGSIIVVKDATIKYGNNSTIKCNDLSLHCSDIIGFSPIKMQDFLNQA
ncbi:MAG: hypothetical protein K0R50_1270 [Eubacterium sp.]|nr:hypothetical protein [Eubacterium sp.]